MSVHFGFETRGELRRPDFFDTDFAKATMRIAMGLAPATAALSMAALGALGIIEHNERTATVSTVAVPVQDLTK